MSHSRHELVSGAVLRDALSFPDAICERLYDSAKRGQWSVDADIDWERMRLGRLAPSVREAMAEVYVQICHGEVTGLALTSRAVDRSPHLWAKLFGATQVADEARHVEFFSRVLVELGEGAAVHDATVSYASSLAACTEPEELLLGVQVILETFAQAVFSEGAKLGREAASQAIRLPGFDDATYFLSSLANYVGKDESRHVAFGVAYIRQRWQEMTVVQRDGLQRKAEVWMKMLDEVIAATGRPMQRLGIQRSVLSERVVHACRAHFRRIGFEGY
jgi:hypothetical protein